MWQMQETEKRAKFWRAVFKLKKMLRFVSSSLFFDGKHCKNIKHTNIMPLKYKCGLMGPYFFCVFLLLYYYEKNLSFSELGLGAWEYSGTWKQVCLWCCLSSLLSYCNIQVILVTCPEVAFEYHGGGGHWQQLVVLALIFLRGCLICHMTILDKGTVIKAAKRREELPTFCEVMFPSTTGGTGVTLKAFHFPKSSSAFTGDFCKSIEKNSHRVPAISSCSRKEQPLDPITKRIAWIEWILEDLPCSLSDLLHTGAF